MIPKNKRHWVIATLLLTLAITSLACNLPLLIQDTRSNEISEQAADNFEENILETVKELKETGILSLTITEAELTSSIARYLQQDPNPFFTNPQVFLRDGEIQLSGDVKQSNITLPLKASLQVQPDGNGGIDYQITSASVGPLNLPAVILNQITTQIENAVGSNITGQLPNLYVQEITISDGLLNIKGYSR